MTFFYEETCKANILRDENWEILLILNALKPDIMAYRLSPIQLCEQKIHLSFISIY